MSSNQPCELVRFLLTPGNAWIGCCQVRMNFEGIKQVGVNMCPPDLQDTPTITHTLYRTNHGYLYYIFLFIAHRRSCCVGPGGLESPEVRSMICALRCSPSPFVNYDKAFLPITVMPKLYGLRASKSHPTLQSRTDASSQNP